MKEFKAFARFTIREKASFVYYVVNDRERHIHDNDLIGQEVLINGLPFTVRELLYYRKPWVIPEGSVMGIRVSRFQTRDLQPWERTLRTRGTMLLTVKNNPKKIGKKTKNNNFETRHEKAA